MLCWLHCNLRVAALSDKIGELRAVAVGELVKVEVLTNVKVMLGMVR